uniref:G-protein coupled receptors family 1 profile domain-containing protein n=1 Tax=Pelusios castaneus TaxID=367368 RepID=A0A8C8SY24_9SAUR
MEPPRWPPPWDGSGPGGRSRREKTGTGPCLAPCARGWCIKGSGSPSIAQGCRACPVQQGPRSRAPKTRAGSGEGRSPPLPRDAPRKAKTSSGSGQGQSRGLSRPWNPSSFPGQRGHGFEWRMNVTKSYDDYDPNSYSNFIAPDFDITETNLPPFQLSPIQWASLVLYSLIFLLGVPGNVAVIWVTGFGMKQTVNTVWFLNLAVADLLCCLALPFLAVPIARDQQWELGDFTCKLIPSLTILNMFASILLLVAISVDRCALVTQPVWCQNHRTTKLAWGLSGVAWLLALLMTIPSFIFRRIHSTPFSKKVTCGVDYVQLTDQAVEVFVAAFRFVAGFLIPFVVIATCYGLVLARVQRSRFTRSRKAIRVILVVIVSFFVCWLPYHVVGLILATHQPTTSLFQSTNSSDPLIVGLAYVNSCINPIIYVIMGQDFKDKFQRSLKTILRNVMNEDSLVSRGDSKAKTRSTLETKSSAEDRSIGV